MDLSAINKICWTVCIVSIIGGMVLSLAMIWTPMQPEFLWKAWTTMGVLFVSSLLALIVTRALEGEPNEEDKKHLV